MPVELTPFSYSDKFDKDQRTLYFCLVFML